MEDKDIEKAKEVYKTLTPKQKREHFWEYHKFHVLAGAIVVFLVGLYVQQIITRKDVALEISYFGNYMNTAKLDGFEDKLKKAVVKEDLDKKQVLIDFYPASSTSGSGTDMSPSGSGAGSGMGPGMGSTGSGDANAMQKFEATVAVGDIDMIVFDKNSFEQNASKGMFKKLDNIKELSGLGLKYLPIKSSKYNGNYGIDATQLIKLNEINCDLKNKYIGIVANSGRLKTTVNAIKWLISK